MTQIRDAPSISRSSCGGPWICWEGKSGENTAQSRRRSLPPFPLIHDKGTFDVFYLLRTPEIYVRRIWGLLAPGGMLFLTSCNCTRSELEELFRARESETEQLFEVADELRHKTFKFGGVEGQVVTSLMFRRVGRSIDRSSA
ncbi:methyltransferase domain protein [Cystoisospora suis]|uniref:Methyltransferase domain protein n=1 Tax=Cystoisospora suis TaxID=483139 RepID=A0A2C6KW80_9APIC|nr:methyltransferase domain protein [Cystoisospora suis]